VRAVVIGGGLAGITAALALTERGDDVTLLEARPRLGGATSSFNRDGLVVDTGQHVFLRCCTAYLGLLDRLDVAGHAPLQDRFDVTVLSPDGPGSLRRTSLPGPLQTMASLARYRFLSLSERRTVGRAALAFSRLDPASPAVDQTRLGDWLSARGQDENTRRVLWDLFIIATLNIAGDDASLALAATVVQQALLGKTGAADIGVPRLPLGELHGSAASRALAARGANVLLNAKVTSIEPAAPVSLVPHRAGSSEFGATPSGFRVGVRDGETLTADAVVLAVPHEVAAGLLPAGALPERTVKAWAGLGASPIVNVHVIYDRKVLDLPFAAAVNSPVQWVFDRTAIAGLTTPGQYLALSQSAADKYVDTPVAQLREIFVPALAELLPKARDAKVTEFFVTRERRATFRQGAGSNSLRPAAATDLPGLVLAGSWTATGWPDTMEGAVRSGLNAVIALHRTAVRDTRGARVTVDSQRSGGTNTDVSGIDVSGKNSVSVKGVRS
jgi:squalene-associated FAD-dependent desaturase